MDHVREYNATYDYFRGMDDESLAKFRQAEAIGHRPTWKMGPRGGAQGAPHVDETVFAEARAAAPARAARQRRRREPQAPRYNALALKALFTLELDGQRDRDQRSRRDTRNWSSAITPTPTAATARPKTNCAKSSRPIIT